MNAGSFVIVPGDVHCISYQASTIAVLASCREIHIVRDRQIVMQFDSATSDFVHAELLQPTLMFCVTADGRMFRFTLPGETKRQRDDASVAVVCVDDCTPFRALDVGSRLVRVQQVAARGAPLWLLDDSVTQHRLDEGGTLSRVLQQRQELLRVDSIDNLSIWTSGEKHVILESSAAVGEVALLDNDEPIVHVDMVRHSETSRSLIAVGAFGTIGVLEWPAKTRVWRAHVGLARCAAPCAVSDDGELLFVNDGERLVAVSLQRVFEQTEPAAAFAAPMRAFQRSVPVAISLRRTPLASDEFLGVALLANGAIVTLEREFLSQSAFSAAKPQRRAAEARSLQRALAELDSVAARENEWRARDAELNDALRDMALALRLAPSLLDRSVVQCRLQASMGQFSVFDERALIGVHVTYSGAAPLSRRWSLSVRSRVAEPPWISGAVAHVIDVPLHQLPPATANNATWTAVLGVPFDVSTLLDVSVSLVFAAVDGDDGWLVPLIDEQRFDALDFCKLVPSRDDATAMLSHSCAVALHTDWHALLGNASADERAAQLLGLLVPAASKRSSAQLLLVSGEQVRLRVSQSDDFQLSVVAECASAPLAETVRACLLRRIAALRRGTEHGAVAATLHHYALAGGGKSAAESAIAMARTFKSCLDKAAALQDEVDMLIASRRAFLAADWSAPSTLHLRKSLEEQVRLREKLEQATTQLRQAVSKTLGL
jgi:hypothetical protein